MASGCDETALFAAMRAGGPVAALLPGGVDVPFVNSAYYRNLYRAVREQGVLVSPYPPGSRNDHKHFFYRNPILTGLSVATLCVEAGVRSGVLNVARHANEQGRTLYVVPANLDAVSAAGTNALLCEGVALPVMSAGDILLPLQASFPHIKPVVPNQGGGRRLRTDSTPSRREEKAEKTASATVEEEKRVDTEAQADYIDLDAADYTQEEKALLRALQEGEKSAEELSAETGLESAAAMSALTMLTLQGSVEELGAGRFASLVRIRNERQEQK
jgi:DNA processing protein